MLFRVARLASVVIPGGDKSELCNVCDDVMGDLLSGTDGIEALPCNWACLRIPKCVEMCERVKDSAANSTHFPCIAAGYCDPIEEGQVEADVECSVAPIFRCVPKRYCQAMRTGFKMSCRLKPGIGRWVGMKNAVGEHAGLLATGLLGQQHCGEPGAGPYCIAKPTGLGAVAEAAGHVLSMLYGSIRTVQGIESPGGDDDRQWLTFWLILTILLFVERFLARVILSSLPMYYELKLGLLCWLMLAGGADTVYRKLRRLLVNTFGNRFVAQESDVDRDQLKRLIAAVPADVLTAAKAYRGDDHTGPGAVKVEHSDWIQVHDSTNEASATLRKVSQFLLSGSGAKMLEGASALSVSDKALLQQSAAAEISFQPRFLYVRLEGTAQEVTGSDLPAMDSNGRADAYVKCRLVPEAGAPYPKHGVLSRTKYRTTRPQWNEELELALAGGSVGQDGLFRNTSAPKTALHVQVYDADLGPWGWLFIGARLAVAAVIAAGFAAYITGVSDALTRSQTQAAVAATTAIAALYVASYMYSKVLKADDDLIGEGTIPLAILMDQKEHLLHVTLRPPAGTQRSDKSNAMGGCGILQVGLSMAER